MGWGLFPDAVSARGAKHLRELENMVKNACRSVIFYCVQRKDIEEVRPADMIDPEYGKTLRFALSHGVEALAYRANVTPDGIQLYKRLPVSCP